MAHDKFATIFPSFKFRGFLMDTDKSVVKLLNEEKMGAEPKSIQEDKILLSLNQ